MDRQVVYVGQIPLETDLLLTNKNTMLALGAFMQAVLGTSVSADGLACVPNSPAALNVKVGPGSIYSLQNVDGTAYGTVAADTTNQVVKQGLSASTQTLSCPAPATTGQSVVYLVQAAYQDTDAGSAVLPYYNASNPAVAWSGPNNSGVSQNTVRKGVCLVGVKAGIAATTGTQVTPAPDAGYTGLYAVTVANGQTTIVSGNITQLATAPFIGTKLPAVLSLIQSGTVSFAADTSAAVNTITASLNPVPVALTNGQRVAVKVANSVTGPTVMNVNGLGNVAVVTTSGSALTANAMVANGIYTLVYDANGNRWQLQGFTAASATGLIPANNLSDVANATTALTNLLPSQTGNAGKFITTNGTIASWSTFGQNLLVFTAPGTFTTPADIGVATNFKFTLTGAGGGGGGGTTTGTAAGGGGAGATAVYSVSGLSPSTAYTVTVGAGGAGSSSGTGSSGGASSVVIGATTVTAGGGSGGAGNATACLGGPGGTASNGTLNIPGGDGCSSANPSVVNLGGHGGASFWGGGGKGALAGTATNGAAYGSGGGGGANTSAVGGNGANGVVMVEWVH
jgi:hypothetical protein